MRDFTLTKYEQLCAAVASSPYTNLTFQGYLETGDQNKRCVILRHDIDEDCRYAVDLAQVEHKYGLRATYYFRVKKRTFRLDMVREIASAGHEVGYHYETVDRCKGDLTRALKLFEMELAALRNEFPVRTACMHGNPLTKYDNREIWRHRKLSDFGLIGEPYLSLDYTRFSYYSDSGRSWSQTRDRKAKDVVIGMAGKQPRNTDDLIRMIADGESENVCILTHPERWPKHMLDYGRRYLIDAAYNAGKKLLCLWRRA